MAAAEEPLGLHVALGGLAGPEEEANARGPVIPQLSVAFQPGGWHLLEDSEINVVGCAQ